ncbi:MAG: porin [Xanthomonadales bacterium]|nr:porin [Xanthomonadales bacterium]
MKPLLMAALLAAGTTAQAAEPASDDLRALIKVQQQQIELLQDQLDATRASLASLSEKVEKNTRASSDANEKAEILAENIDSQVAVVQSANRIGGYGEMHVNMLEDQATGESSNVLDFHRFVLFYQHDFNERLRFNSELEVEHAYSGDNQPGYVELEQAYIEYDWAQNHHFKAGLFLLPVGILNETHEPPTFYGTERNPIEKNIIPTTWWEGGLSFGGSFADAFRYDFAAHSGLFTTAEDNYAIRAGRQKGAKARFDSQAYTGRLRWLGIPGLELSASVQYQEDISQETDPLAGGAWLYTGHLSWQRGHFGLRALYADWSLDGEGPEAIGADRQAGWYIEPSWRFNENWGVFARYNSWDNKAGSKPGSEYTQWDVGVNYWLHPNVVFKLDYQDQGAPDGKKEMDGWNLGVGYQF